MLTSVPGPRAPAVRLNEHTLSRAEAALQRSAAELPALFAAMQAVVVVVSRDGRLVRVAPTPAARLYREALNQAGQRLVDLLPEESARRLIQAIQTTLATGAGLRLDFHLDLRGTPAWFTGLLSPLSANEVLLVVHDITEHKQREADLAEANLRLKALAAEAAEASAMKSEFLANISHELRTPLTGILGALEMIRNGWCQSPEEEAVFAGLAWDSAQRMTALVHDLVEIASLEAGRVQVYPAPLPLASTAQAACRRLAEAAEQKGLTLAPLPAGQDAWVVGDPEALQSILTHLLNNAIKFTERGAVRLSLVRDPADGRVGLQVADTGIGLTPETRHRLFEAFRQGDGSATRRHGGAGLGLAIAHRLARLLGGALAADSPGPGQGSTFTLWLQEAAADQRV